MSYVPCSSREEVSLMKWASSDELHLQHIFFYISHIHRRLCHGQREFTRCYFCHRGFMSNYTWYVPFIKNRIWMTKTLTEYILLFLWKLFKSTVMGIFVSLQLLQQSILCQWPKLIRITLAITLYYSEVSSLLKGYTPSNKWICPKEGFSAITAHGTHQNR